jgi:hypothetical protein
MTVYYGGVSTRVNRSFASVTKSVGKILINSLWRRSLRIPFVKTVIHISKPTIKMALEYSSRFRFAHLVILTRQPRSGRAWAIDICLQNSYFLTSDSLSRTAKASLLRTTQASILYGAVKALRLSLAAFWEV